MTDNFEKIKKRKRQTDGSTKPSKRVAIEGDVQVKVALHSAERLAPVVASTPGVALPPSIALKPYTKFRPNAPQRQGKSGDIATKELLLHSSEHEKLDYTAREEEAGGTDALSKHYIGVYDPETRKLDVVEARKMVVRGVVRAHQQTVEDEVKAINMREQRNILGQTFGTKKARKAIQSLTDNAISPEKSLRAPKNGVAPKLDAVATAMLASMKDAAEGMASRYQMNERVDVSKPRPKANLEATEVKDVYTVESLIGLEIFKSIPIKTWQDLTKHNKEVVVTSKFVAARVQAHSKSVEKLRILKYMNLLISFFKATTTKKGGRMLPKRDAMRTILGDMPESILENLKRKFSDGGQMSKFQADQVFTHCAAMSLLVDNYETDTTDLRFDLMLEPTPMNTYFSEIGARVMRLSMTDAKKMGLLPAAASQRYTAKLKLPLVFPKQSVGRKR